MAERAGNNFQVSATGGAGTSGQAKQYIPGMTSLGSSGTETMAQQGGAAMYKEPTPTEPTLPPVAEIGAPTSMPDVPVTDGAPMGAGVNSIPNLPSQGPEDPDIQMAREYFPILEFWASQPGSSQGTKDYVTYLGTIL